MSLPSKEGNSCKYELLIFVPGVLLSFLALLCGLSFDSFWRLAWTALGAMFYFPKYSAFILVPEKMEQIHPSDGNYRRIIRLQNPSEQMENQTDYPCKFNTVAFTHQDGLSGLDG